MASTAKLISILILFTLLFSSIQIQARDLFSKIPNVNINNNEQETSSSSVPNKEDQTTFGKTEQEPRFIPQTQNGYGLYGHESGQFPPSTTNTKETYVPYVTPVRYHPDEPYNSIPASKTNDNNRDAYFYSKSAEESTEQQNLGEARFTEKGWSTKENRNNNEQNLGEAVFTEKGWSTKENQNNNNNYYNGNNGYKYNNGEKQNFGEAMFQEKENQNNKYYNGNNGYNNGERQGMSDTRYLENGKYYYDLKSENSYYPNQFENSRGVASRNEFDENRYNNNNMGRYNQNQEEFEEENEEEFEP